MLSSNRTDNVVEWNHVAIWTTMTMKPVSTPITIVTVVASVEWIM